MTQRDESDSFVITLEVQVDRAAWYDIYGNDRIPLEADVRGYVVSQIGESAAAEDGAIVDVRG